MNEHEKISLIEDPSVEEVLKAVRPAGEMTTDERLERRKRQERDAVFNRILISLNGVGYTVSQFAEWAGGKKDEPSTADKMREIRKERDKNVVEKRNKPARDTEDSEPVREEQGNRRTAQTPARKAPVLNTKTAKALEETEDEQQQ